MYSLEFANSNPGAVTILGLAEKIELPLVWCPPGDFLMGSLPGEIGSKFQEYPKHPVRITKGFWIGQTPITQEQWNCVTKNPTLKKDGLVPADGMMWDEARDFCSQLTDMLSDKINIPSHYHFDLPTEAEWEYACRAGTSTTYFWGNLSSDLGEYAWYKDNGLERKHDVAQKKPNPWGLYDMYGNVSEWCLDSYSAYQSSQSPLEDPLFTQSTLKIARGGSYFQGSEDCRSAARETIFDRNPYYDPVGFRVALVCGSSHGNSGSF